MAITYEAAASLLEDVVGTVSYTAGTGDTGVLSTYATSIIVNLDKVTIKRSMDNSDHSGGQNPEKIMRGTKFDTQTDIDLKFYVDANTAVFLPGLQVKFAAVVTIGEHNVAVTIFGIITDIDNEFAGPSTMKISIKPYAVGGNASYTAVYT